MLNNFFKLEQRATSITTEVIAGVTTFITMAYILAVMPTLLANTGMSKETVFFATCLGAGLVTIVMGLVVNCPIALGPGLGLGAYFASVAASQGGIPWQIALGGVFIAGIIFFILTITHVRQILVAAIPGCLKHALTVGIGLFITLIGLKMSHVVTVTTHIGPSLEKITAAHGMANLSFFEWDLNLGSFTRPDTLLAFIGLAITATLFTLKVRGSILIGIIISALIGIPLGLTNVHDIHFSLPALNSLNIGAFDIKNAFNFGLISIIFTFVFVGLMDTFATLVSISSKAGLLDDSKNGGSRLISRAMMVDSIGLCVCTFFGLPALTEYLESLAGISAGGRTGLTSVVTGVLFLLSLFLSSLFIIIPSAAVAPVLILLGTFMISNIQNIDFGDFSEGLPAFLTIIIMPFTYSIANGISAGVVFYVLLKLVSGKWREIHWMMYILLLLIILRFTYFI